MLIVYVILWGCYAFIKRKDKQCVAVPIPVLSIPICCSQVLQSAHPPDLLGDQLLRLHRHDQEPAAILCLHPCLR